MTLEEMKEKYPIGSIQRLNKDIPLIGATLEFWAGAAVKIVRVYESTIEIEKDGQHFLCSTEWLEDEPSIDYETIYRRKRDANLRQIFAPDTNLDYL